MLMRTHPTPVTGDELESAIQRASDAMHRHRDTYEETGCPVAKAHSLEAARLWVLLCAGWAKSFTKEMQ